MTDHDQLEENTKLRRCLWVIGRRLGWIAILLGLLFLKTFLHPK